MFLQKWRVETTELWFISSLLKSEPKAVVSLEWKTSPDLYSIALALIHPSFCSPTFEFVIKLLSVEVIYVTVQNKQGSSLHSKSL